MLGPVRMVGNHHAAAAGGDQLVAVEAVNAHITDGAGVFAREGAAGVVGAQRLGGILDQDQVVFLCNAGELHHIRHVAEHMHHQQGLHMAAGGVVDQLAVFHVALLFAEALGGGGIHAQAVITADEHRLGVCIAHRVHGSDEGEGGHDHLVARTHAGNQHGQMQAGRATVAGHSPIHVHIVGDGLFKVAHLAAAGGHPLADHRVIHIFFFLAGKIWNRQRNKVCHFQ